MKLSRLLTWMLFMALGSFITQGCASSSEEQEDLMASEMEGDMDMAAANPPIEEPLVNQEDFAGSDPLANADLGMDMGNPPMDESNLVPVDEASAANLGVGGDIENLNNIIEEVNTGANPAGIAESLPPMEGAAPVADEAMAASTPAVAPPSGATVYFVTQGGADLMDSPGGNAISRLAQGDPCLVTIEGEWANLANRGYVKVSQLSSTPVGRNKALVEWN